MGWVDKELEKRNISAKKLLNLNADERDKLVTEIANAVLTKIRGLSIGTKTLKIALKDSFSRQGVLEELREVKVLFKAYMKGLYVNSTLYALLSKIIESMEDVEGILKSDARKKEPFTKISTRLLSQLDTLSVYLNKLKSMDYWELLITKDIGQRIEVQNGKLRPGDYEPLL